MPARLGYALATLAICAFAAMVGVWLAARGDQCSPADPALLGVTFTHGAEVGFLVASGMLLVAGIVAFTFNRIRHEDLASGHTASPAPAAH